MTPTIPDRIRLYVSRDMIAQGNDDNQRHFVTQCDAVDTDYHRWLFTETTSYTVSKTGNRETWELTTKEWSEWQYIGEWKR